MKLILIRHAETLGNIKGILEDSEGKLSKEGLNQIKKLALRLKNEEIDAIFSSPYQRAKQTALSIAKYHKEIPIFFVEELKEMYHGSYSGKKSSEIDWENMPSDMESRNSLYKRAKKILLKVYKQYKNKTVLFVGHNAINKTLVRVVLNKNPEDKMKIPQFNTCVSIFEISKNNKNKVHLMNCTKHLD